MSSSSSSTTRWCPTCQEDCLDHGTICTTCGTALQSSETVRVVPQELERNVRATSQNLNELLASLRSQVRDLEVATDEVGTAMAQLRNLTHHVAAATATAAATAAAGGADGEWQVPPAEAMDPQQATPVSSRSRGTAKTTLSSLPRIVLEEDSYLFHQATLNVNGREFGAIPADFGPTPRPCSRGRLIVAEPLTGMGGLSTSTINAIETTCDCDAAAAIVYMERGDGITFVQKALMAQRAGASAVVIGNHQSTPWPYVMKDSKGEAGTSLKIPVVMVKQTDGHALVGLDGKTSQLNVVKNNNQDCVVCRDEFEMGQTVIQLPACGHVFHENCAVAWLTHHNACPYCRREMPCDDPEYERERRRTQRTHAGSATTSSEWHDLYG